MSNGRDNTYGADRVDADETFWYLSLGDRGASSMSSAQIALFGCSKKWVYNEPLWNHDIVDWYKIYTPSNTHIYVKVIPESALDVKISIVDLYGRVVASVDSSKGSVGITSYYVRLAGYYYIKVDWQGGGAEYDLYVHIYIENEIIF